MQDVAQVGGSGLLKVAEVALRLGLSIPTIYKLMDKGDLPYIKIGNSRRIDPRAIETLIQKNTIGAK